MQEFNRGIFDFLIATDDPTKQQAGTAADPAVDPAAEQAASSSQRPGQEDEPDASGDQDQVPDHPWAEATASAQLAKVRFICLQT